MSTRTAILEPIRHQGRLISYEIAHRPRVTRRIHLELNERGRLRVVVPRRLSRTDLHRTLQDSADYVARFLEEARARRAQQVRLRYADGEKHLLLGRHYPLDIRVWPGERRRVEWMSDRIRVILPERPDRDSVRDVLLQGYRQLALEEFAERLHAISLQAPWARRRPPPLRVRRMRASWGTCSVDGIITLNPLLLRAPSRCVDYVIVHEVCHLREHNHGQRFYALQEQLFPDWQKARRHLHDKGHIYLQL
jgi:predicted metal-dependent hydrolase